MLIVFNKAGSEFSVDFQYDSFSQGDSNTHIVDVIVEDTTFSNYEYNAYVQFLRNGEKEPSPKLIMATKRMEYNGNYYSGYTFAMQSDWFTAIAGTLKMTIEIKKYSNGGLQSNKAYGVVNIPVQESVSTEGDVDSGITKEDYNAMIELINSKVNNDDAVHKYGEETITGEKTFEDGISVGKDSGSGYAYVKPTYAGVYHESDNIYRAILYARKGQAYLDIQNGYDDTAYHHDRIVLGRSGNYKTLNLPFVDSTIATQKDIDEWDDRVVHTNGEETIHDVKTFSSPIHLENENLPFIISDVVGKVGMRAYTESGGSGKIAGQVAVSNSYWDDYEGHFANVQAYDKDGVPHSLIVSKKGAQFDGKTLATQDYVFDKVSEIVAGAPSDFDSLKEIANWIKNDETDTAKLLADVEKKAYRNELFSKNYDDLFNAPEKLSIVVRDTISADTYNEAREIQIGRDKFKFGSGSKIKANEFVDGTLPTLEYLNIDGKTYKLPDYAVDKSGLKLVAEGDFEDNSYVGDKLTKGKVYLIELYNFDVINHTETAILKVTDEEEPVESRATVSLIDLDSEEPNLCSVYLDYDGNLKCKKIISNSYNDFESLVIMNYGFKIYELPLGESAQVEKHNKTINALMQRVSDLEQKAGLTSVGYVQDNTLNLIRVNVVDDVLEVSGFKFDGEVMII